MGSVNCSCYFVSIVLDSFTELRQVVLDQFLALVLVSQPLGGGSACPTDLAELADTPIGVQPRVKDAPASRAFENCCYATERVFGRLAVEFEGGVAVLTDTGLELESLALLLHNHIQFLVHQLPNLLLVLHIQSHRCSLLKVDKCLFVFHAL